MSVHDHVNAALELALFDGQSNTVAVAHIDASGVSSGDARDAFYTTAVQACVLLPTLV